MHVIIYGFNPQITEYAFKDICFFLLVFAVLLVLQGRLIERNHIQHQYMQLIRYGKVNRWWNRICIRVILLSMIMVLALFLGMAIMNQMFHDLQFQNGFWIPLLLWCMAMISIGFLQLLLSLVPRGLYLSFLLCLGFEIVSLYMGLYIDEMVGFLPGSFMMLRRTRMMDGVMPIWGIVFINVVFILVVRGISCRLLKRSCR